MSGRKPMRLNNEIRARVALRASEHAKKVALEKGAPAFAAFRDAVVDAWIGDGKARTAYANAPSHFFAARRVEFSLPGSDKRVEVDDLPPLPARPAFDLSVDVGNWMLRVDVPEQLTKLFLDACSARNEAWQKHREVQAAVSNALDAYTLVKQARAAVPELSPFLPPDYQDEADATVGEALRDTLSANGLAPQAVAS